MKENKKIIIIAYLIILGGLLIFPFLPFLTISIKLIWHRSQIQNSIGKSDFLDTIFMESGIYHSLSDKREFLFRGDKYDVYKVNFISDQTVELIAFKDDVEDWMLFEIMHLFTKEHEDEEKGFSITHPDWNFHIGESCFLITTLQYKPEFFYTQIRGDDLVKNFPHPPNKVN